MLHYTMDVLENLRAIVEKKARLNAKEREFVTKLAAEHDIPLNPLCPDCYKDAAIQLYSLLKPKQEPEAGEFELKDGVDLVLNKTERICAATCTDENARRWLAMGVSKSIFAKMPADED